MKVYLIGIAKNNKKYIGFRLLDVDNKQVIDVTSDNLKLAISKNKIKVENIELSNGEIKGINGSLDRYPIIDGSLNSKSVIIIEKNNDNTFKCCNYLGKIADIPENKLVEYSKLYGIANGKIVNNHISSISGTYETTNKPEQNSILAINLKEFETESVRLSHKTIVNNVNVDYDNRSIVVAINEYKESDIFIDASNIEDDINVYINARTDKALNIKEDNSKIFLTINYSKLDSLNIVSNTDNRALRIEDSNISRLRVNKKGKLLLKNLKIYKANIKCDTLENSRWGYLDKDIMISTADIELNGESSLRGITFENLALTLIKNTKLYEFSADVSDKLILNIPSRISQIKFVTSRIGLGDIEINNRYKMNVDLLHLPINSLKHSGKIVLTDIGDVKSGSIDTDELIIGENFLASPGMDVTCNILKLTNSLVHITMGLVDGLPVKLIIKDSIAMDPSDNLHYFRSRVNKGHIIIKVYYGSKAYYYLQSQDIPFDVIDKESIPDNIIRVSKKEALLGKSNLALEKDRAFNEMKIATGAQCNINIDKITDTHRSVKILDDIRDIYGIYNIYNNEIDDVNQNINDIIKLITEYFEYDDTILKDEFIKSIKNNIDIQYIKNTLLLDKDYNFGIYSININKSSDKVVYTYLLVVHNNDIIYSANITGTQLKITSFYYDYSKVLDIINKLRIIDIENRIVVQNISTNIDRETSSKFADMLRKILKTSSYIYNSINNDLVMCHNSTLYKYKVLSFKANNQIVFGDVPLNEYTVNKIEISNNNIDKKYIGDNISDIISTVEGTEGLIPDCEITLIAELARKYETEIMMFKSYELYRYRNSDLTFSNELWNEIINLPIFNNLDPTLIKVLNIDSYDIAYNIHVDGYNGSIEAYSITSKSSKYLNEYQSKIDEVIKIDDSGYIMYISTSMNIRSLLASIRGALMQNSRMHNLCNYMMHTAPYNKSDELGIVIGESPRYLMNNRNEEKQLSVIVSLYDGFAYLVQSVLEYRRGKRRKKIENYHTTSIVCRIKNLKTALKLVNQLNFERSKMNQMDESLTTDLLYHVDTMYTLAELQYHNIDDINRYKKALGNDNYNTYINYIAKIPDKAVYESISGNKKIESYNDNMVLAALKQGFITRIATIPKDYKKVEEFDLPNNYIMTKYSNGKAFIYNTITLGNIYSDIEIEKAFE